MIAPFILNAKLLDVVTERIINVSSISLADTLDWDNLQSEKGYEREGHAGEGASTGGSLCGVAHAHAPPPPPTLDPCPPAAYALSKLCLNMQVRGAARMAMARSAGRSLLHRPPSPPPP